MREDFTKPRREIGCVMEQGVTVFLVIVKAGSGGGPGRLRAIDKVRRAGLRPALGVPTLGAPPESEPHPDWRVESGPEARAPDFVNGPAGRLGTRCRFSRKVGATLFTRTPPGVLASLPAGYEIQSRPARQLRTGQYSLFGGFAVARFVQRRPCLAVTSPIWQCVVALETRSAAH